MKRVQFANMLLLIAVTTIILYFVSLKNYLFFHTLVEFFGFSIAITLFFISWNTREFGRNNFLVFLGVAYLFVGSLDFLHALAYKGMNIFSAYDADLPTQLWIVTRYIESLTILLAVLFINRRIKTKLLFLSYFFISATLALLVFLKLFPSCYIEGQGLTVFKKISEYIISFILIIALLNWYRFKDRFDHSVQILISISIILTIFSEIAFTFYVSVYGLSNFIGHIFKFVSFYLIYKALIYKSLKEPYQLIFHELKETESRYRLLFENMKSGFALHKLIVNDDNKPVDYEFIDVNKAFEKHSGLVKESVIGKRVLEVLPDIKSDSFDWIGKYGEITQNNKFADFESYSKILKRWFNVKAYSPMKGYFATIIEDITDKKNLQIKLTNQTNTLQAIFDNAPFILALVDENLKIERINRVGIEYSGKKESDILGNLSGSVFNCINTFDGVSCGNGANCQTCPIRTSVYYTAKHGKPVNNREGQMELLIAGKHTPVDLLISTSLIKIDDKDKILLSLIDITERKRIEVMLHEALDLSRQKEAEVENLLQEKELLLREVHHRIKNNMSTVESLLRLHMKQIDNKEAQAALIDANSRIRSVQVLYEKLFRSDNFNEVDMRDYLSPMLDEVISVFPVHSEVAIIKKIDSFPIDAKLVFPFGIIINEIVTNIMKYAFVEDKQDKKIEVTAEKIENQARVIIHDNGMGMPPDFNLEEAKGFGLHLVKMLINQIKGEMKIENVEGTKFTLIFPLNAGKK